MLLMTNYAKNYASTFYQRLTAMLLKKPIGLISKKTKKCHMCDIAVNVRRIRQHLINLFL